MAASQTGRGAFTWAGLRLLDKVLARYSTIPDHEVFPNSLFPWAEQLEENWAAIRSEADKVLRDRRSIPPLRTLSPDHNAIAVDDRWRSYFLWGYGLRWKSNCEQCPETARLLEGIPGLLTAFFSVLLAGSHIPRHTGPTKAILTAHLGLTIPRNPEACRMQVGGRNVTWQEGRVVVFDDMYPHEVWNDSDEDRVVLLLQVKRPQRFPGCLVRDGFFSALRRSSFVQDGLRNLEQWEKAKPAGVASL